ncbi:hypothetical protein [Algoriphagus algorifonticola]|uniref:hypothetical protein n=1 Tax=Algoriphagus algorifonticola TaxID=2593007 RepID=UPI0011A384EA|nr:hypothetical protein [Algoriphagus algorifonticola]
MVISTDAYALLEKPKEAKSRKEEKIIFCRKKELKSNKMLGIEEVRIGFIVSVVYLHIKIDIELIN